MTDQLDQLLVDFAAVTSGWDESTSLETMRAGLDRLFTRDGPPPGTKVRDADISVSGEWVAGSGSREDAAMLLIHGGGFSMGSARAHRAYAGYLSHACKLPVLTLDYRLAPEHSYPAAHDDCFEAWSELIASGIDPERIVLCGDSAGGGMALSLALRLRDIGEARPGAIVLVSPWADMTASGDTYSDPSIEDPISSREMALGMAAGYLGDADPKVADVSPVFADLADMPPTLILAGEREVFLDDARSIAAKLEAAGGNCKLEIWPGMIHQFPLHVGALPEAQAAIEKIGVFVRASLA